MAIWVMPLVAVAPCQCFSFGSNQTTSPGWISSTGPPSRCTQPQPETTINVCPSGCVCHAVLAPGSNVTLAAAPLLASLAANKGSILTAPVNQSSGPLDEGCEPIFEICMWIPFRLKNLKLLFCGTESSASPIFF